MSEPRLRGVAALTAALLLLLFAAPARAGLISQEQEITIGRQAAAQLESQYPLVREIGMIERINRIGGQLLEVPHRDLPYSFKVLDVNELNAMALPGGFVYATRGIMEAMPDDQLAFVLSHEVAHVEDKHSVTAIETDLYKQVGLEALLSVLNKGQISEGTANSIQIANMLMENRYSQAMEAQADHDGIVRMHRAGYSPQAAVASLQTLQARGGSALPGFVNWFLGDHPMTADRIQAAQKDVARIQQEEAAQAQPPPSAPIINSVIISPQRALRAGDTLTVVMTGEPGGRAAFDIVGVRDSLEMPEVSPGNYRGSLAIQAGMTARDAPLMVRLDRNGQVATRQGGTVTIAGAGSGTP